MEMLRYCRTVGDIQLALKHLPPTLEAMYADALNRIRSGPQLDAARGIRILLWVVFAARPLRVDELQFILATSPQTHQFDEKHVLPEKSLLALCHGLVTVESGTRFVRLVREWSCLLGASFTHPCPRLHGSSCTRTLAARLRTGSQCYTCSGLHGASSFLKSTQFGPDLLRL